MVERSAERARAEWRLGDTVAVLVALLLVGLSVAIGAWILARDGGTEGAPPPAATVVVPASGGSSSPLVNDPDALMLAERSGSVLVGLAAAEGGPVDLLLYGADQEPLDDADVRVSIDDQPPIELVPGACGEGCARLETVALAGAPLRLAVTVSPPGGPSERVVLRLPARMPPDGTALFEQATATMKALRSLRIEETLSTGTFTLRSTWEIEAPDRLSIESSDGGRTVVIGDRRWDLVGGEWVAGPADLGPQPSFPFEQGRNARILGTGTFAGQEVTRLAVFVLETQPWWFVLDVAPSGRILRERMLAPSHFMVDVFTGFDEAVSIEAPA